jgi:multidrug efflux system membrane fusion protein
MDITSKWAFCLITVLGPLWMTAQTPFAFARPSREAELAFPQSGILASVDVREGEVVEAGELLARLNQELLDVDLEIARENVRLLEMKFAQMERLNQENRLSPQEFERAKADLRIARLEEKRIQTQLEERNLRAPFAGVVTRIHLETAEQVPPSSTPVMTLVALDPMHIEFFVSTSEAKPLQMGQRLKVEAEVGLKVEGEVIFISPLIDPASQTQRIRLSVPNPDGTLQSGMRCQLSE